MDDETFYKEYNEEFSQDGSDTKCFQVWTSTKKKLSQSSNVITCNSSQRRSPQPQNPSTAATLMPPRPKYAGEKIPNFMSTNSSNGYSSSSVGSGQRNMVTPPLSPGNWIVYSIILLIFHMVLQVEWGLFEEWILTLWVVLYPAWPCHLHHHQLQYLLTHITHQYLQGTYPLLCLPLLQSMLINNNKIPQNLIMMNIEAHMCSHHFPHYLLREQIIMLMVRILSPNRIPISLTKTFLLTLTWNKQLQKVR